MSIVVSEGTRGLVDRFSENLITDDDVLLHFAAVQVHSEWCQANEAISLEESSAIRKQMAGFPVRPAISIVMPLYSFNQALFIESLQSITLQSWKNWQLFISCNEKISQRVIKVLELHREQSEKIHVVTGEGNSCADSPVNRALEEATGDYIAFVEQYDLLAPHALYFIVEAINTNSGVKFIYSDEDRIDKQGRRSDPHFKSSWNPLLFQCYNYISHLCVVSSELLRQHKGLRPGLGDARFYDLFLRVTANISDSEIIHVPFILYHWRFVENSIYRDCKQALPASTKSIRAVTEHLCRLCPDVTVTKDPVTNYHQLKFKLPDDLPHVSVVIPTRDMGNMLKTCIDGVLNGTDYNNLDIVVIDNDSTCPDTLTYLMEIGKDLRVKVIKEPGEFNFSSLNNNAINLIDSTYVLLLNNDIEIIDSQWLKEMVSLFSLPNVGIVGAKLLYPDLSVQHAGLVLGIHDAACHVNAGLEQNEPGNYARAMVQQDLSVVTGGCLLIKRAIYLAVGGLNDVELKVAYNDVDLCLKVREAGYRVLWTPYARLIHHEAASRGPDDSEEKQARAALELTYMREQWGNSFRVDPFYNPNLTLTAYDSSIASVSRAVKPWMNIT